MNLHKDGYRGEGESQINIGSILQEEEHPSPLSVLLSSHAWSKWIPSPQIY